MSRGAQAAWLAFLTAADIVALVLAFAGAALSPVVFRSDNPALPWTATTIFVVFLLVTILAPLAAWGAFLLRRPRAAWAFGFAPLIAAAAAAGFVIVAWLA
jgi:hypothetical protein